MNAPVENKQPMARERLSGLFQQRNLVFQLTRRAITQEVKGSLLGMAWTVLSPLLMLTVYAVVFGLIFGARFEESPQPGPADYVLGLFLGLTLYNLISDILNQSPRLIVSQPNYVKKVVFPLATLPLSLVGAALYRFGVTLLLVLLGIIIFGQVSWHLLLFPLTAAPLILLALALAYLFSALGVFFRDIAQMTSVLSMILLYGSGVFYAAAKVEQQVPAIWEWIKWNPVLLAVESSRRVLLWGQWPELWMLAYTWVFALAALSLGYYCFGKLRPAFADVL